MRRRKLKASFYNHFIPQADELILFNARTLATVSVKNSEISEIKKLLSRPQTVLVDNEPVKSLIYGGFLVDEDYDERLELRNRMFDARNDSAPCLLTISPTLGCNFNCNYCFEDESVRANYRIMDEETQDEVVKFLKQHFLKYNTKLLDVTWFGGEPLMGLKAIERLSSMFIRLCEIMKIEYNAHIITNGYKLNSVAAKKLAQCNVHFAQITIDGPKFIHDSRRILKGGRGTYDNIVTNIKNASEYIRILIRINIDKDNQDTVYKLMEDLEEYVDKSKVDIYLAPVVDPINTNNANNSAISAQKFAEIDHEFRISMYKKKYNTVKKLNLVKNACSADHAHSFMIGPKGELYQCWEDFGNQALSVGNIFDPEKKLNSNYVQQYIDFDPTTHPKCSKCNVMPLCMGGCPKQRLAHDEPQCGVYKYNLHDRVLAYVNKKSLKPSEISIPITEIKKTNERSRVES